MLVVKKPQDEGLEAAREAYRKANYDATAAHNEAKRAATKTLHEARARARKSYHEAEHAAVVAWHAAERAADKDWEEAVAPARAALMAYGHDPGWGKKDSSLLGKVPRVASPSIQR